LLCISEILRWVYILLSLATPKKYIIPNIQLSLLNCYHWVSSLSNKSASYRSNFSVDIFCRTFCIMVNSNNNVIKIFKMGKWHGTVLHMRWQLYYNNIIDSYYMCALTTVRKPVRRAPAAKNWFLSSLVMSNIAYNITILCTGKTTSHGDRQIDWTFFTVFFMIKMYIHDDTISLWCQLKLYIIKIIIYLSAERLLTRSCTVFYGGRIDANVFIIYYSLLYCVYAGQVYIS